MGRLLLFWWVGVFGLLLGARTWHASAGCWPGDVLAERPACIRQLLGLAGCTTKQSLCQPTHSRTHIPSLQRVKTHSPTPFLLLMVDLLMFFADT